MQTTIRDSIEQELVRAREIHPVWVNDTIHAVAIVAEESGEAVKAALDHGYIGRPVENIRTELIQTAAMCIRCLEETPALKQSAEKELPWPAK